MKNRAVKMNLAEETTTIRHLDVIGARAIAGLLSAVGYLCARSLDESFDMVDNRNRLDRRRLGRALETVRQVVDLLDVENGVA